MCGSSARRDLCGGCWVTDIPTATINKNYVIPAKAGIQLINNFPRKWDKIMVLPAAQGNFLRLDSGLRRNDGLMDYLK